MVVSLSEEFLKILHKAVLDDDPKTAKGYRQEGMIGVCAERAVNVVYGHKPFKNIVSQAAALVFSINAVHPFRNPEKKKKSRTRREHSRMDNLS